MEPGGSHGLQNRSRPDDVGLGGFDSHALPPTSAGRNVLRLVLSHEFSNDTVARRARSSCVALSVCASRLWRAASTRLNVAARSACRFRRRRCSRRSLRAGRSSIRSFCRATRRACSGDTRPPRHFMLVEGDQPRDDSRIGRRRARGASNRERQRRRLVRRRSGDRGSITESRRRASMTRYVRTRERARRRLDCAPRGESPLRRRRRLRRREPVGCSGATRPSHSPRAGRQRRSSASFKW